MPSSPNVPGGYIEELPSAVHPISGASTSDTAFVDWFSRGPIHQPTRITSFAEFTRIFGGLHAQSAASYGIFQYFQQGGSVAWVVRVRDPGDTTASFPANDGGPPSTTAFTVGAANPGAWGDRVQFAITTNPAGTFNLFVREVDSSGTVVDSEVVRNLSLSATGATHAVTLVNDTSRLVALTPGRSQAGRLPGAKATATGEPLEDATHSPYTPLTGGKDTATLATDLGTKLDTAMQTLARIDPFVINLLCIPAMATLGAAEQKALVTAATTFCRSQRAFLLVDLPETVTTPAAAQDLLVNNLEPSEDAALYYPRLLMPDPLSPGVAKNIAPSGAVAGVMARTDSTRGVWKAPAGTDAAIGGVTLAVPVTEADTAALNPLGINVLRTLPAIGTVVWGARTLLGADTEASEWKYIAVRRTALYLEQSLKAGLKWVVSEANDERLWSRIRLTVEAFLQDLSGKGAFQSATPREAYFVRCDATTTTHSDIDRGLVNILVGFAPLKPAEFVVIQIQQLAGQTTS